MTANPGAGPVRLGCGPTPCRSSQAGRGRGRHRGRRVRPRLDDRGALATLVTTGIVAVWTHCPAAARPAFGAFTAVAMALVAFDLIHDGVFGR